MKKLFKRVVLVLGVILILIGIGLMFCAGWYEALPYSGFFHFGMPLGGLILILAVSMVASQVEEEQESAYN